MKNLTIKTDDARASDFDLYVQELRSEWLSSIEIVQRWMKQARPDALVEITSDSVVECMSGDFHMLCKVTLNDPVNTYHVNATSFNSNPKWHNFDNLSSALAWLANQARDLCILRCYSTEGDDDELIMEKKKELGDHANWNKDPRLAVYLLDVSAEHSGDAIRADSLCRMYGLSWWGSM